jgi:hypothetical protein
MFNIREGKDMKRGFAFKVWVFFLCVSFLLLASGFHTMIVEAKEIGRPLGEMVSRGEVKFESRKAVWKNVELSQFPIFSGMRIKIEKGASLITLEGNRLIEVKENSLLSFDRSDQIQLTEGTIDFRLPSTTELSFKVGDMTVIQSKSLEASKNPSAASSKSEATIGSISVHSNGAVTVRSFQGSLSVLNQKRVLASLSSKDAVTLPSVTVKTPPKVMVAQASEKTTDPAKSSKFLGVPTWVWIATGMALGVAVVAVIGITATGGGGDGTAVCP